MKTTILISTMLLTTSTQVLSYTFSKQEIEAIRDRGEIIHYDTIGKYKQARQGKKKYLVIGCGHGAFIFNNKTGNISSVDQHGPDTNSIERRFSHGDAFTVNYRDGEMGPKLGCDINGMFPKDLNSTEKFDEIFIETIGLAHDMYTAAFDHLIPGGILIDNRYGDSDGRNYDLRKSEAIDHLIRAGFIMIDFKDNIIDPHNGRANSYLVYATKPNGTSKGDVSLDYNNPVIKEIAAKVQHMKADGSFTTMKLYEMLKGYYRNVPDTFKALYIEFTKK